jgi:hypothetical protein
MTRANHPHETALYIYIAEGQLPVGGGDECRVERLEIRDTGAIEIRFSWWKNGRLIIRPLHATEEQLLDLFNEGIRAGVFTPDFRRNLKRIL